ncbi:MAG: cardiolipin synthase [Lachnospiraceae bacterium]|nr:cardiolipin synthase [Lachnospiraceae bacterium]
MEEIFGMITTVLTFIVDHAFSINILLAITIVFFERRDPKTIWTWLLVLYFIPVLGFLLYLLIGQDMRKSKMFKNKELEDVVQSAVLKQEQKVKNKRIFNDDGKLSRYHDLVMYNLAAAKSVYTDDNDVEIYTDGKEYFAHLYEAISTAKEFIHIQSYIIKNDELWQALEKLLYKKVKEGVQVRILYDSMGCRKMGKRDWERIQRKGIQVGEFFPAFFKRLHLRINYRNHRKIIVIDGTSAYVGGFNIGREYLGLDKKFGYWRDTHLRISGSAAVSLHVRFILDWNYATKQNLFENENLVHEFVPGQGKEGVQIITSGPDTQNQEIRDNYQKLIGKARDHVYIQTPYLVPDEIIVNEIKMAAYSGIDVKIMIPCKPDHPLVYWATYSYVGELIDAGVKCYTYDNGFLHAKGVMSDGLVCSYGTANMDVRSFALNFEVNATIYSQKTTSKLEKIFEEDLAYCTEITPEVYAKRSLAIRIKEQFSRMFSFIL